MSKTLSAAAAALFLITVPSSAHHAFASEYDENKVINVSGTVVTFSWTNPHAWLYVEGKDDSGNVARWKDELKMGDHVSVDGYCAKDGGNVANARTVTLPDGRKVFGGFQTTPGAPAK